MGDGKRPLQGCGTCFQVFNHLWDVDWATYRLHVRYTNILLAQARSLVMVSCVPRLSSHIRGYPFQHSTSTVILALSSPRYNSIYRALPYLTLPYLSPHQTKPTPVHPFLTLVWPRWRVPTCQLDKHDSNLTLLRLDLISPYSLPGDSQLLCRVERSLSLPFTWRGTNVPRERSNGEHLPFPWGRTHTRHHAQCSLSRSFAECSIPPLKLVIISILLGRIWRFKLKGLLRAT